jgi:hypothetical protein
LTDEREAYRFAYSVALRFNDQGQFDASMQWQGKAIDSLEAEVRARPDRADARELLAQFLRARALGWFGRREYAKALMDWDRSSQLTAAPLPPDARVFRAGSLAKEREHVRAAAEVQAITSRPGLAPDVLYDLAGTLAISVSAARQDSDLASGQRAALEEDYGRRAMDLLRQSHAAGFFKSREAVEHFRQDGNLNSLRSRKDFQQFAAELVEPARNGR